MQEVYLMFKKYFLLLPIIFLMQCSLPDIEDVTPPVVVVAYPYDGAVISATVDVRISAADDEEVTEAWYYLDGVESATVNDAPYEIELNPSSLERKIDHYLQAAAKDKEGNIGYSDYVIFTVAETHDIIDPTVSIVNPQDGQVVEGIVDIVANAEDERSIQKVAFYINGDSVGLISTYPYTYQWNTSTYSDSTEHTIYAKAWDGGNNTATSEVITVTVFPRTGEAGDDIDPSVLILYPLAGTTITGTVQVSADLFDNVAVSRAEFYVDGQLENSANNPSIPWIFDWDTTPKADGELHSIYIKAYDAAGNIGTSTLLTLIIN